MLGRQVPNYEIQCFYNSYCNALSSLIKSNLFLNANIDYLALAIRFLIKEAVLLQ